MVLVDSAATTDLDMKKILVERRLAASGGAKTFTRFLTTDDPGRFAETGGRFLGMDIRPETVELVDL